MVERRHLESTGSYGSASVLSLRLERIHLVAVTGYGQLHERERSVDAGFGTHLVKPLDATDLRTMLARLSQASPQDRSAPLDVRQGFASADDAPVADRA